MFVALGNTAAVFEREKSRNDFGRTIARHALPASGDEGGAAGGDARVVDLRLLRRFFLGVLGWTPQTVMRDATLQDLQDAYAGFHSFHGLQDQRIGSDFLVAMMKKFPDKTEEKK